MPYHMKISEARKLGLEMPRKKGGKKTVKVNQLIFRKACVAHGLTEPISEYPFHNRRKWRVDFMFFVGFNEMVALEIQGGLFVGGRHTRGAALIREYEKLNALAAERIPVVFVTPDQVESGEVFEILKRVL